MSIAMPSPIRVRRSALSVPAVNRRALEKVHSLDCDCVIFDLEDSVAPEKKGQARDNLRQFFCETSLNGREAIIRINALSSEFGLEDLDLVASLQPDALLLPKVSRERDLQDAQAALDQKGAPPSVRLWAMMETAEGVMNAASIAASRHQVAGRLDCLVLGLNDLRKETRVPRRPGRVYLVPWMMQVVLAARAHGLDVIDSVFNDFRDTDAFALECEQGREMGFDGKMLIHPAQIEPANQTFGPSDQEIADAEVIVAAFHEPEAAELNVINIEGRMVERLHLEQATRLLAQVHFIQQRKTNP